MAPHPCHYLTTRPWTLLAREREGQNPDWFEAGIAELGPAIAAKRAALLDYKKEPSDKTLAALRKAGNDAQRIARSLVNDYWLNLFQSIQPSADCGNIRAMHVRIHEDSSRPKHHPNCTFEIMQLPETSSQTGTN